MSRRKGLFLCCAIGAVIAANIALWSFLISGESVPAEGPSIRIISADASMPAARGEDTSKALAHTPEPAFQPPAAPVTEESEGLSPEEFKERSTKGFVITDHRPRPKPEPKPKVVTVITGDEEPLPEGELPPADIRVIGK